MKKVISSVLAFTLMMSLSACATKAEETKQTTVAVATEATVSMSTDAETTQEVSDDKIVIGMTVGNLSNEANVVYAEAAEAYAQSIGVELLVLDGEGSAEKQVSQCESFVAQGVDAVIMQAYDAAGCVPGVQACIDAGIPVFASKTTIEDMSLVPTYVGSDDFNAGKIEMTYIAEQLGGKGNIVILEGPAGISAATLRNDGIQEILKSYPDIKVLYNQPANWNRDEGMQLMENWLQLGEQIDAVVAHNDEMALGAYDAISDAGLAGTIYVIGIDAITAAKESVINGEMDATVLQDGKAIGEKSVDVAIMLAKGETVDELYDIPFVLLTPDNIAEYN